MRQTIVVFVGILIFINIGCASYTPEEEKACSRLVTKTTSLVHTMSGTVYVLHGADQSLASTLDSMRFFCLFLEKDGKGNLHMQCGSPWVVDPDCVERYRKQIHPH